jgi:hypothetical protein
MSKPIYLAIAMGVVLAVVWFVMRRDARLPAESPSQKGLAAHPEIPATGGAGNNAVTNGGQAQSAGAQTPQEQIPRDDMANAASRMSPTSDAERPLPIDVSPGFELLNKKASSLRATDPTRALLLRHEELQSQPRDPAWSEQMEAALTTSIRDSLTARGLGTERIELPVVECRRTGCEIQAIGFVEDNGKPGVDPQMIVPMLLMGPLSNDLHDSHGFMSSLPDGRLSYIFLLARRGE